MRPLQFVLSAATVCGLILQPHAASMGSADGKSIQAPSPFAGTLVGPHWAGATSASERAVLDALRWLARHQQQDGSWSVVGVQTDCDVHAGSYAQKLDDPARHTVGLTGLALLAFLAQGLGPDSKLEMVDTQERAVYRAGAVTSGASRWLEEHQRDDGALAPDSTFDHALGSHALIESFGLSGDAARRPSAEKALAYLLAAQCRGADGSLSGFASVPLQNQAPDAPVAPDSFSTAWALYALRSAQICGLEVPPESFAGCLAFLDSASTKSAKDEPGESSSTQPISEFDPKAPWPAGFWPAVAMNARILATDEQEDPRFASTTALVARDVPSAADVAKIDFTYWHFAAFALFQYDGPTSPKGNGKAWGPWRDGLIESLTKLQDHSETCARGSWPQLERSTPIGGPLYATALNTITLQVFYRYDNMLTPPERLKEREEQAKQAWEAQKAKRKADAAKAKQSADKSKPKTPPKPAKKRP
jgi:hypothetical protein